MVFFQAEIDITSSVEGIPPIDFFESRRAFFIPAYIVLLGAEKSIASREGRRLATYTLSTYLPTSYLSTFSYLFGNLVISSCKLCLFWKPSACE